MRINIDTRKLLGFRMAGVVKNSKGGPMLGGKGGAATGTKRSA